MASDTLLRRLDNNRLTGTLPTKIGLLESLSILYVPLLVTTINTHPFSNVQVNQLSGPIPTVFGNLNSLRFLYVSRPPLSYPEADFHLVLSDPINLMEPFQEIFRVV